MSDDKQRTPAVDDTYGRHPGMPRWVKVTAIVVGVLILLFVILQLTGLAGQHGPGRHLSDGRSPVVELGLAAVGSAVP
jgi:hypothetical protein